MTVGMRSPQRRKKVIFYFDHSYVSNYKILRKACVSYLSKIDFAVVHFV